MKMWRPKIFGLIFLILLVAPVATIFTILRSQQKQVRKEVKCKLIAGLDKSELVELKFKHSETKDLLHWKHAGEFSYKGQMYDIVEQKVKGDSISYWCWWDHEETILSRKLDLLFALDLESNSKHQSQKQILQKLLKSLHFHELEDAQFAGYVKKSNQSQVPFLKELLDTANFITSPPPQFS